VSVLRRVGQYRIDRCCSAVFAHRNLLEKFDCALPVARIDRGIERPEQACREEALVDRHAAKVRTLSTHVIHRSAEIISPPELGISAAHYRRHERKHSLDW
jgi:hypothetical protein